MQAFPVSASESGARLDRFVQGLLPGLSRRDIRTLIAEQRIFCNGQPASKGRILAAGDRVELVAPCGALSGGTVPPDPGVRFEVLFEDPFLVAAAKPPGLSMHPLRPGEMGTLANGLVSRYPEMQGVGFGPLEPGLLHRLDRETSGIVLAARRADAFQRLRVQFENRRVIKIYLAVAHGCPPARGVIDRAIASRGRRNSRVWVEEDGRASRRVRHVRAAQTRFRVVRASARFSLVRLLMTTGARHQLRAHLAWIGHPVAGDRLYGGEGLLGGGAGDVPERHLLHASELRLLHPGDGRRLRLRCPLPRDFQDFLRECSLAPD